MRKGEGGRRGGEEERKGSQHGASREMDRIGSRMNERRRVKVSKREGVGVRGGDGQGES